LEIDLADAGRISDFRVGSEQESLLPTVVAPSAKTTREILDLIPESKVHSTA
jgi:hypothetical protein